jgi:hypothetical protein
MGGMASDGENERSPMATAMAWVSQITTISLEMVLPGVAGVWIDSWLGTKVLCALLGFTLGLTVAILHLTRLRSPNRRRRTDRESK